MLASSDMPLYGAAVPVVIANCVGRPTKEGGSGGRGRREVAQSGCVAVGTKILFSFLFTLGITRCTGFSCKTNWFDPVCCLWLTQRYPSLPTSPYITGWRWSSLPGPFVSYPGEPLQVTLAPSSNPGSWPALALGAP